LYVHKGYSIITASQVLFLLLLAEAFGTFLGGVVADRWGYKRVIVMTLALASPFYYLFLHGPAFSLLPFVLLLGLCLGATSPMTMGLVQSLLPASRATVSGLALGSSFVAGGVGAGITGVIADRLGLMRGLDLLIILPLIASFLCLLLPAQSPFVSQEEVPEDETAP
jgi:FSR family fosmidomycin resistance protein-like MFS transporter